MLLKQERGMEREKVNSSSLASIGYKNDILEIEFRKTGDVYQYLNVPEDVFLSIMKAKSKGAYFTSYIRENYDFKKVKSKSFFALI
jgi:hypothetical protein